MRHVALTTCVLAFGLLAHASLGQVCAPRWLPGNGLTGLGSPGNTAIAFDPDGDGPERPLLYVAGEFVIAGDVIAMDIAVWDGSVWSPVGAGFDGNVLALMLFDDGNGTALYAGGTFTSSDGVALNGIARWDGQDWQPLGTGFANGNGDASVRALAVFDDGGGPALYAGGDFDSAGGIAAPGIARWDGVSWSSVGLGTSGIVHAMHVFDIGPGARLAVGGDFSSIGQIQASNIAQFDGASWAVLPFGTNGPVLALETYDPGTGPALAVGGSFTSVGGLSTGGIALWNGQDWSSLGRGISGEVRALTNFDDGNGPGLFVGGDFDDAGGSPTDNLAKWNGGLWESFDPGASSAINKLIVYESLEGESLYPIGAFKSIGGTIATRIARWDGSGFSALGSGTSDPIEAFAIHDDGSGEQLYAAGLFQVIGGTPATRVARWNGRDWTAVGEGTSGTVFALAPFNGDLYAGGRFLRADGNSARRVARWDGTSWNAVSTGANNSVRAFAVFDDGGGSALYAGGDFTEIGGVQTSGIARWDGASWTAVGAGIDGDVYALFVFDDGGGPALFAGGLFGTPGSNIAKWDGQAWVAVGGGTDGLVRALASFGEGPQEALYAGGDFAQAGGAPALGVARWDGANWTDVNASLAADSGAYRVSALAVFDEGSGPRLFAGGRFDQAGGGSASSVARFDGANWSSLGSGINFRVEDLIPFDPDGPVGPAPERLVAGGNFAEAGDFASAFFAQWGQNENVWAEPLGGEFDDAASWFCGRALSAFDTFLIDAQQAGFDPEVSFTIALPPGGDAVLRAARLLTRTNSTVLNLAGKSFELTDGSTSIARPALMVGDDGAIGSSLLVRNTFPEATSFRLRSVSIGETTTSQQRDNEFRVSGFFTSLEVLGDAYVGRRADRGRLIIEQAAGAMIEGTISIGTEPGSVGELNVIDTATVLLHSATGRSMAIGQAGTGSFLIGGPMGDNGADVSSIGHLDSLTIGTLQSGVGAVTVRGGDSRWDFDANRFTIGLAGQGTLTIRDGAELFSDTLEQVAIGFRTESDGRVVVQGTGSRWRELRQSITVGPSGSLGVYEDGLVEAVTVTVDRGGVLLGDSRIGSDELGGLFTDVFNLGEVFPSDFGSGPGVLRVNGRYRQVGPPPGTAFEDAGVLRTLIAGGSSGETSLLEVNGEASLGGGLVAELGSGYTPDSVGQRFPVLTATTLDPGRDRFDVALMPRLNNGQFFRVEYSAGSRGTAQIDLVVDVLTGDIDLGDLEGIDVSGVPVAAAADDLNGDGLIDLALAVPNAALPESAPGSVLIFFNLGSDATGWRGFGNTLDVPVGVNPRSIDIGDVDGIGGLDICVANAADRTLSILSNTGSMEPTIIEAQVIALPGAPGQVAFGDSIPDGGLDELAVSVTDQNLAIVFDDRTAFGYSLAESQMIETGSAPGGIGWGSLDNDKWDDIIVVNGGGDTIQGFPNDTNGGFSQPSFTAPVGRGPTQAITTDLDGDGSNDIVVVNRDSDSLSVLLGIGGGQFAPSVELPVGELPQAVIADDLDNDKDIDIALLSMAGGQSEVQTLRNDYDAVNDQVIFAPAETVDLAGAPIALLSGDADGDGSPDLITVNQLGTGSRGTATARIDVKLRASSCPGDVDGNGSVGTADITFIVSNLGTGSPGAMGTPGDANGDGVTDTADITFVVSNLGSSCL